MLVLVACHATGDNQEDTPRTIPTDGTSVLQLLLPLARPDGCGLEDNGNASSDGGGYARRKMCRLQSEVRVDDSLVEATPVRVDTDLARERDAATATVAAAPTVIPDPPEATAPDSIQALICSKPWPCESALCLADAESDFDPNAYNADSGTTGLLQLRPSSHWQRVIDMGYTWEQLYDATINVEVAYAIYVDWQGFAAWDGSPQCY